jgi:cytochrome P450
MSVGVNIEFVERDHNEVMAECLPFVERFREEFYAPSLERRTAIVARFGAGEIGRAVLPLDLITLMLLHREHFEAFGPDTMLREAILFNGASGGINHAACNTLDALLRWAGADPASRRPLLDDMHFLRRAALEAIRVRPATPFQIRRSLADQVLGSGRRIAAGEYVLLDMFAANHDRSVWGEDADRFDPFRLPREPIKPTGLAFSNGAHTCIAAKLSIGDTNVPRDDFQGLLVSVLRELFRRDVRLISAEAAKPRAGTTRSEFDTLPISLAAPA